MSVFWTGFLGSIVVEVGTMARACANMDGGIPQRYKSFIYLPVRFLLALCGGAIATVFDAKTGLVAFYLGASAPVVIDKLAQGALPTLPPDSPG